MAVVALHPVVVHLEGVFRCLLSVDDNLALGSDIQCVTLVNTDGTFIDRQILQRKSDLLALLGNPNGAVIIAGPSCISVLRVKSADLTLFYRSDAVNIGCLLLQGFLGRLGQGENTPRLQFIPLILHTDSQFIA